MIIRPGSASAAVEAAKAAEVAVVSRRPRDYLLTHIEGDGTNDNFPVVNESPIGAQAYAIQNGDIIELAGIKMEFNLVR